ncbi:hypothetical protein HNQ60_002178 [Povalibacter uvarum]|uniref:Lipoprotein n=1 Tax=Povalibacter uvarum TaxID=732238 RepID=A0A841HLY7_9GAMM|nr:hypothetical protein [Povalibacter uvarum]MBB6093300.1 hypothetical protein [Povalibacter uvarum]
MGNKYIVVSLSTALCLLLGCIGDQPKQGARDAQQQFWSNLGELCGKAFAGGS